MHPNDTPSYFKEITRNFTFEQKLSFSRDLLNTRMSFILSNKKPKRNQKIPCLYDLTNPERLVTRDYFRFKYIAKTGED